METINRNSEMPKSAQFAVLSNSGNFIQKFYSINEFGVLQFFGERGNWSASEYKGISDIKNKVCKIKNN